MSCPRHPRWLCTGPLCGSGRNKKDGQENRHGCGFVCSVPASKNDKEERWNDQIGLILVPSTVSHNPEDPSINVSQSSPDGSSEKIRSALPTKTFLDFFSCGSGMAQQVPSVRHSTLSLGQRWSMDYKLVLSSSIESHANLQKRRSSFQKLVTLLYTKSVWRTRWKSTGERKPHIERLHQQKKKREKTSSSSKLLIFLDASHLQPFHFRLRQHTTSIPIVGRYILLVTFVKIKKNKK